MPKPKPEHGNRVSQFTAKLMRRLEANGGEQCAFGHITGDMFKPPVNRGRPEADTKKS